MGHNGNLTNTAALADRLGMLPGMAAPQNLGDSTTDSDLVAELTQVTPEVDGQLVTAPVTDPRLLPAVVRRLDDEGVVVTELTLRNASLNEVFLTLTGHAADEDEQTEGNLT